MRSRRTVPFDQREFYARKRAEKDSDVFEAPPLILPIPLPRSVGEIISARRDAKHLGRLIVVIKSSTPSGEVSLTRGRSYEVLSGVESRRVFETIRARVHSLPPHADERASERAREREEIDRPANNASRISVGAALLSATRA